MRPNLLLIPKILGLVQVLSKHNYFDQKTLVIITKICESARKSMCIYTILTKNVGI